MKKKEISKLFCLSLFVWLLIPFSTVTAKDAASLIGEEASFFTLPSTEDRAVNYLNDYYGKCLHSRLNGRNGGSSEESLPL
jgi:hypothetical protein